MSDLELIHGETKQLDIAVVDGNDAAVDITGSSFWFTVKRDWLDADADALITKTVGSGITIDDAPNGSAVIDIDPADFAAFANEPVIYVWGLTEKDASADVHRLARGTLLVSPAVQEVIP